MAKTHPRDLMRLFEAGQNITAILKAEPDSGEKTQGIIETAYDLQAGSYVKALNDDKLLDHKTAYGTAIADEIRALTEPTSIIEAGVGEGTTFSFVLNKLNDVFIDAHGFDISWSRIAWCKTWMSSQWQGNTTLAMASLLNLPYADSCFDVVYTSHTIEPNGGNEKAILQELFRITSRYLVLLEPGYELATTEAQQRMERHGYCKGLVDSASSLGMRVRKHELFGHSANPLNPTAITVIEKEPRASPRCPQLVCPNFQDELIDFGDALYSPESLRAYPKLMGIPCLRKEDAVIASAFEKFSTAKIAIH